MPQAIQMNVDDEFVNAGDAIGLLIADISAKKSIGEISGDVLPKAMAAITGYASFAADIKKVDNQLYLLRAILKAVEPAA